MASPPIVRICVLEFPRVDFDAASQGRRATTIVAQREVNKDSRLPLHALRGSPSRLHLCPPRVSALLDGTHRAGLNVISDQTTQDRDLLNRLDAYFDELESHARLGEGWLILNADRRRAQRLSEFMNARLREYSPLISYYILTWRDFALHAYVTKVELESDPEAGETAYQGDDAYRIANRVSQDMYYHMLYSEFFVLSGVAPSYPYETSYLDNVLEQRQERSLPTTIITPRSIQELEQNIRATSVDGEFWDRFFDRIYKGSLIAV